MNLNTITRKILLAARALHIRSLNRTQAKAAQALAEAERAQRIARSAWYASIRVTNAAADHGLAVHAAVEAERRELGIDK